MEAALIFPLLIMLTFGIIEFALLMRDHVATTSLVRSGARTASALPRSDAMILAASDAMARAGSAMPKDSYEELWIYAADDDGLPVGNASFNRAGCTSNCTVFRWDGDPREWKIVNGNDTWPEHVNACPGSADAMAVGVYLKVKHTWLTGLFDNESDITDRAVMKFEPLPPQACKDAA